MNKKLSEKQQCFPQVELCTGIYAEYIDMVLQEHREKYPYYSSYISNIKLFIHYITSEIELDLLINRLNSNRNQKIIILSDNPELLEQAQFHGAYYNICVHAFTAKKLHEIIMDLQPVTEPNLLPQEQEVIQKLFAEAVQPICIECFNLDVSPRIIFTNKAFQNLTGYTDGELKEVGLLQLIEDTEQKLKRLKEKIHTRQKFKIESVLAIRKNSKIQVEITGHALELSGKGYNFYSFKDITQYKKKAATSNFFKNAHFAVAEGQGLTERGEIFLQEICRYLHFEYAEGWVINMENTAVRNFLSFGIESDLACGMKKGLDITTLDDGLPGITWRRGQLVEMKDLQVNPFFKRRYEARKYDLSYAVSMPLVHRNKFLGSLLLFARDESLIDRSRVLEFYELAVPSISAELARLQLEMIAQSFFTDSPSLNVILTREGEIIRSNNKFKKLTDNQKFKLFFNYLNEPDAQKFKGLLEQVIESGAIEKLETTPGPYLNYNLIWSIRFNEMQNCIFCTAINVSKLRKTETFLQRNNQLSNMGHWEVDLKKEKVYWSAEILRMLGLSQNTSSIEDALQIFSGVEKEDVIHKFSAAIKGEKPADYFQGKIRGCDGRELWISGYGEAIYEEGECVRIFGSFKDISNEVFSSRELKQTKDLIRFAAHDFQIGYWEYDINLEKLHWDTSMYSLFGLDGNTSPMEFCQKNIYKEDLENANKLFSNLGFHDIIDFKFRIITPKGKKKCFVTRARLYQDAETTKYVGLCMDISSREQKQRFIERLYRENEDIINSITDAFIVINQNGEVSRWNKAAADLSGITAKEIVGKKLLKQYPSLARYAIYTAYKKVLETQLPQEIADYAEYLDLYYQANLYPHKELSGAVTIYIRDITAVEKAKKELEKIKDFQKAVINSSPDLIWAVNCCSNLIMENTAYNELVRYLPEKFPDFHASHLKWSLNDTKWEKVRKCINRGYKTALKGKAARIELEFYTKAGKKCFKGIFEPIYKTDCSQFQEILGVACFLADETKLKDHIKKIENQNLILKSIAWKQSHLVRAPLARLMGLIDLLEHEKKPEEAKKIRDHIRNSSEELDQIIKQISHESNQLN